MEPIILKNKEEYPDEKVLQQALKESYPAFTQWETKLQEMDIIPEWNYYRDGNNWLYKMLFKKKNMAWLFVCDNMFGITFYFLERHLEKIAALDIDEKIKEEFAQAKPHGKLIPMTFRIRDTSPLKDVETVMKLKKTLK